MVCFAGDASVCTWASLANRSAFKRAVFSRVARMVATKALAEFTIAHESGRSCRCPKEPDRGQRQPDLYNDLTGRPEEAPNPSIRASVPSIEASVALTSRNRA